MVKVTIGGGSELKGAEANVVEGLVINAVGLVGVFDKLMDGEGGVVGFDNSVGYLGVKRSNRVDFCIQGQTFIARSILKFLGRIFIPRSILGRLTFRAQIFVLRTILLFFKSDFDSVSYLGGGDDRKGVHDTVWVFLTDLGNKEGSHSGSGTTSEGMGELESLKKYFSS